MKSWQMVKASLILLLVSLVCQ